MGGEALLSWLTTLVIGGVVVLLMAIAAGALPRMSGLVTVRVSVVSCRAFPDPRMGTGGMSGLGAGGGGFQAREDREAVAGLLDG